MTGSPIALGVDAFVALLLAALLISIVAERVRIPPAVLLVGAGMAAGTIWHVRPPFEFGQGLLFVFLPPLVFEAAWNIDLPALRTTLAEIALLAFPGTLVVAFAIAFTLAALRVLPFAEAFLLGAMVGATDPVAVVAVFRRVGVPTALRTIVEGESLANDGVAVLLYGIALALASGRTVAWGNAIAHGVVAVLGGIAVGVVCAFGVWRLMRLTAAAEYEVTVTIALAYIAYLIADHLQLSGIFATASAGVLLRFSQHRDGKLIRNVDDADAFWNTGAYVVNAIVFISTGLLIDASRIPHEPLLIVATLAVVFISRALLVVAVVRDARARLTVLVAGMRGALPLALAISLPGAIPDRAPIIDAVFATVFVTLVVQGLPLAPLVRALYADQSRIGGPESSS